MRVVFRADADERIGAGHLMRCLALAEGFREKGHEPFFLTRTQHPNYLKFLQNRQIGFELIDEETPLDKETELFPSGESYGGAVIDRYELPMEYMARLRSARPSWTLLAFDDWGIPWRGPHLVLNQNIGASRQDYNVPGELSFRLLAGSAYTVLRPEFRKQSPIQIHDRVSNILITMGGSDPDNITRKVVEAVAHRTQNIFHVVAGPGYRPVEALSRFLSDKPQFRLYVAIDTIDQLMGKMDLAISASGSTLWELYTLGIPNILYILADNQQQAGTRAADYGSSISLGLGSSFNKDRLIETLNRLELRQERVALSEKARHLVDGQGVDRVVNAFLENAA